MCSLTGAPALVPRQILQQGSDLTCKKCRQAVSSVVLRLKDTYCQACFLVSVQHKVRATLGKHKATRPGDRVLVGASGGQNSTTLLHLLQQGRQDDNKKLLFLPLVLFIEEGVVTGESEEGRRENVTRTVDLLKRFGFVVHVVLLEDYCSEGSVNLYTEQDSIVFDPGLVGQLRGWFGSIKEGTAKQELLLSIRRSVLVRAAVQLECSKVFTAENGSNLAIELLTGVACGAGGSLTSRVRFRDQRGVEEVTVLRPMRDVSAKEVALYCTFNQLPSTVGRGLGTGEDTLWSIRKLTEDFLVGLQQDFPATIPTIFKTGDKLSSVREGAAGEICLLCSGPLDTDLDGDHNALQATRFSSIVSAKGRKGLEGLNLEKIVPEDVERLNEANSNDTSECCGQSDGSCGSKDQQGLTLGQVELVMCYACRRTLPSGKVDYLPSSVREGVRTRLVREKMKKEISEFLL